MSSLNLGPLVLLQPLWLIVALILAIIALRRVQNTMNNDWQKIMSPAVFEFLSLGLYQRHGVHWALWSATVAALCLTQPVVRSTDDETWRHSIGWIMVMDVSRSMTLNDTVPSRLSAARQTLSVLSEKSGARPIAMIIYAGDAFLIAPPAFDKSVFDENAALLEYGIVETDGSNLTRALSLASSVIADSGFVVARVFVLTDTGGINASSISAVSYLAENGHTTDVLTFGTTAGTANGAEGDTSGALSPTAINRPLAENLATAGNGQLLFANGFGVVDFNRLSLTEHGSASTHADLKTLVWADQSHWLLLLCLPLLLFQFHRETQR